MSDDFTANVLDHVAVILRHILLLPRIVLQMVQQRRIVHLTGFAAVRMLLSLACGVAWRQVWSNIAQQWLIWYLAAGGQK